MAVRKKLSARLSLRCERCNEPMPFPLEREVAFRFFGDERELNALPIDREATGRKSSDQIRELIDQRWSLVIYPEGGRSPDGWGQEFKGGAAYLSGRTGAPVVPVFIDGTGAIFGCPAHDQRDLEFARKYALGVTPVVLPPGADPAASLLS